MLNVLFIGSKKQQHTTDEPLAASAAPQALAQEADVLEPPIACVVHVLDHDPAADEPSVACVVQLHVPDPAAEEPPIAGVRVVPDPAAQAPIPLAPVMPVTRAPPATHSAS